MVGVVSQMALNGGGSLRAQDELEEEVEAGGPV